MRGRVAGLERIELERLRSRVGRLVAALEEAAEMFAPHAHAGWMPPVDVCETCGEVVVRVELPGVRADAVKVSLTSSHLHVAGRKRKGAQRGVTSHLCTERFYGEFERTVPLRWPVRAQEATAELRDGLLTVRLPKLKERRGGEFKISVTSAE